jgi:hypothetical protein
MTMRIATLRKRVARGVREILDVKDPGWWENGTTPNGIDIDKLDMHNDAACILGQRQGGGGFWDALARYGITKYGPGDDNPGTEYGLNLNESRDSRGWSKLTELWIDVIQSRRFPRRAKPKWVVKMGLDKVPRSAVA